ncbi:MAG: hypothetical protein Q9187_000498 [Circinaria calcarea]
MFYNIRYIEETGRDTHPWSTRTIGIYQKHNFQTRSNTWIVIQPSTAIKRLIVSSTESHSLSPLSLHTTLLNSTLFQWPTYLKHLNWRIANTGQNARLFEISSTHSNQANFQVAISDVQRLLHLSENLQDASLILDTNISIQHALSRLHKDLNDSDSAPGSDLHYRMLDQDLQVSIACVNGYQRSVQVLLSRAERTSTLIHVLLSYMHHASLAQASAHIARIATTAEHDSKNMLELAASTRSDSRTMKLVAIVSMLYLPGTLVAVRHFLT